MATLKRKIVKVVLVVLVVLLVIVALCLFLLQSSWGKNKLRAKIENLASEAIRGNVEVANLSGSLLKGVKGEGLVVLAEDGLPVLEVSSLSADYSLTEIADMRVDASSLSVNEPVVYLRIRDDGTTNFDHLLIEDDEEPSPLKLVVDALSISGGRLVVLRESHPNTPLEINNINLQSTLDFVAGHTELVIKSLNAELAWIDTPIEAKALVVQEGEEIRLSKVSLKARQSTLMVPQFVFTPSLPEIPQVSPLTLHLAKNDVEHWGAFSGMPSDMDAELIVTYGQSKERPWHVEGVIKSEFPDMNISAWANPESSIGELRASRQKHQSARA